MNSLIVSRWQCRDRSIFQFIRRCSWSFTSLLWFVTHSHWQLVVQLPWMIHGLIFKTFIQLLQLHKKLQKNSRCFRWANEVAHNLNDSIHLLDYAEINQIKISIGRIMRIRTLMLKTARNNINLILDRRLRAFSRSNITFRIFIVFPIISNLIHMFQRHLLKVHHTKRTSAHFLSKVRTTLTSHSISDWFY